MARSVQAFSASLRRVTFRDCKLDSVNFRSGTLTDVRFENCLLRDIEFGGSTLRRVSFGGSTLTQADFARVTCTEVDLRDAELGISAGYESLRGATIDSGGLEIVSAGGVMSGATLSGGGELTLAAGALVSGGVVFAGSSGSVNTLQIGGTAIPGGLVLSGFTLGDVIDLASIAFDSSATLSSV